MTDKRERLTQMIKDRIEERHNQEDKIEEVTPTLEAVEDGPEEEEVILETTLSPEELEEAFESLAAERDGILAMMEAENEGFGAAMSGEATIEDNPYEDEGLSSSWQEGFISAVEQRNTMEILYLAWRLLNAEDEATVDECFDSLEKIISTVDMNVVLEFINTA